MDRMKKNNLCYFCFFIIFLVFLITIQCSMFHGRKPLQKNQIVIDYSMPLEVYEWLRLLKLDNDYLDVKDYFLNKVVNTPGCKAALRYLDNFTEIDGKEFYKLIIEALYASSEKKIYKFDGYFTSYGRMKNMWLSKLAEPQSILETINTLNEVNLSEKSEKLLKKYLPDDALINTTFYFYVYGDIESPLMGMKNGADLFNLPVNDNENIEFEKIIKKIAQGAFYDSFEMYADNVDKNILMKDKICLVRMLAKSGFASYFFKDINESFLNNSNYYMYDYPEVWETQYNRLPELYILADRDLQNSLKGEISKEEIVDYWLQGKVTPASVLGYDMVAKIDKYLGLEKAVEAVKDYRKLMFYYDRAAKAAYLQRKEVHRFDKQLAYDLAFYTGK